MKSTSVYNLFEQQVTLHGQKIAVDFEHGNVSYHELYRLSEQLANLVAAMGIGRDTVCAVWMSEGIFQVISLLATQRASSIFMPLDRSISHRRLEHAFHHCEPAIVLTDESTHEAACKVLAEWKTNNIIVIKLSFADRDQTLVFDCWRGSNGILTPVHPSLDGQASVRCDDDSDASCYIYFTSGSTGVPKAILGRAASLAHFIQWEISEFGIGEDIRVSQLTAFTFDAYLRDVFLPLCSGGTLCIPSPETRNDFHNLVHWIDNKKIALVHCVPSFLRAILYQLEAERERLQYASLKLLLSSGEPLYGKDVAQWRSLVAGDVVFVNLYGPSETTMIKSFHRIDVLPEDLYKALPIGKPIANTFIAIINNGELCSIGETGEIHIKTPFMTKGYYKDDSRTQEVFIQNPFVTDRSEILYKTGDLGRYLADRSIEVLGRIDEQVKVNGVRIEPGEIERVMLQVDGVEQVVVIGRNKRAGGTELCCYYTGQERTPGELKEILQHELNSNTIPGHFIYLLEFPLTLSGKVDRKALSLPSALVTTLYEAPQNDLERLVEKIWCDVLGIERVSRNISFFDIGGHSLKAIQLISRLSKDLSKTVKLSTILKLPTIELQARLLASMDSVEYAAINPTPLAPHYALSHAQKRLWILSQFKENQVAYNMVNAYRLTGSLNTSTLERAFEILIERNESLRTRFIVEQGEPRQQIIPPSDVSFSLDQVTTREKSLSDWINDELQTPFDLAKDPLIRVRLVNESMNVKTLIVSLHHIVSDGWSLEVMIFEVISHYNGLLKGNYSPPVKRVQYKDYANWQHVQMHNGNFGLHQKYWKNEFSDIPEVLRLDTDYQRPPVKTFHGEEIVKKIDRALLNRIQEACSESGASVFMYMLSSVNVLLYKYTGQKDIVVGTTVSGRDHADLEDQIGFYVNTLAIRSAIKPDETFKQLLSAIQSHLLDIYDHQEYPFDTLVGELDLERDMSHAPLFDVLVEMLNISVYANGLPAMTDIEAHPLHSNQHLSKYDLSFRFIGTDDMELVIEFNTDLFERKTVERMLEHYDRLLLAVVDDATRRIKDIQIMTSSDHVELQRLSNGSTVENGASNLVDIFHTQAELSPNSNAVSFGEVKLTYSQLDHASESLAQLILHEYGLPAGSRIAIMLPHSEWLPCAVIGVLKSGSAFVPVDPAYPVSRIEYILSDAKVGLLITDSQLFFDAGRYSVPVLAVDIQLDGQFKPLFSTKAPLTVVMDQPAYILYTSGTTGRPKGVAISHESIYNYIRWSNDYYYADGSGNVFGWFTSFSFDLSLTGLLGTLCRGDELRIYPREFPDRALQQIFGPTSGVTATKITPSHLSLAEGLELEGSTFLRNIILGGEHLTSSGIATAWRLSPAAAIYNEYGPTEATVGCSVERVLPDTVIGIGKPIDNTSIHIINSDEQLQVPGLSGEIVIAGKCLSIGYWSDKEETSRKFKTLFDDTRVYKTGDMGRWKDGRLHYIGRVDHQLKLHGHRVEPDEISRTLQLCAGVKAVLVHPREENNRVVGLVCYYVGSVDQEALQTHAADHLPRIMIPDTIIKIDAFPLTVNGKIDVKQLPDWRANTNTQFTQPTTDHERLLVAVFEDVLGKSYVGIRDNFFQTGGDSIKAIQIASRLHRSGFVLEVQDIFQYPEIILLARCLKPVKSIAFQEAVQGETPLTPIQSAFFCRQLQSPHHFNQAAMLSIDQEITKEQFEKAIVKLINHHDALRMVFPIGQSKPIGHTTDTVNDFSIAEIQLSSETSSEEIAVHCNRIQSSISIENGPLIRATVFRRFDGNDLLHIVIHHLVIDGVSWRILLEDLAMLMINKERVDAVVLPMKTDSFQTWAKHLHQYAAGTRMEQEIPYWSSIQKAAAPLTVLTKRAVQSHPTGRLFCERFELSAEQTILLLTKVHRPYSTRIDEILLASFMLAASRLRPGRINITTMMEGHGREALLRDIDVTRTIGWFTSLYPIVLTAEPHSSLSDLIITTKETLRKVPTKGVGYGILTQLREGGHQYEVPCRLSYNYLGQFDDKLNRSEFSFANEPVGDVQAVNDPRWFDIELTGLISNGVLSMELVYDSRYDDPEAVKALMEAYHSALLDIIAYCDKQQRVQLTPSDLTYDQLSVADLSRIASKYDVEDIYSLSPLQEGILFHHLADENSKAYFEQMTYRIKGSLNLKHVKKSMNELMMRHESLRSIFLHQGLAQPVQVVLQKREADVRIFSLNELDDFTERISEIQREDAEELFNLSTGVLFRVTIVQLPYNEFEIIWSHHHIIMDGWCNTILMDEYMTIYKLLEKDETIALPPAPAYGEYVKWLKRRPETGLSYWNRQLSDLPPITGLPKVKHQTKNGTYHHKRIWHQLDESVSSKLRILAAANNVTACTVFHAIWAVVLSKYSISRDVVFGSIVSGRPSDLPDVERMVGLFINCIPVRVTFNEIETVTELLRKVQGEAIDAQKYHYVPLSQIAKSVNDNFALFDHIITYENYPLSTLQHETGIVRLGDIQVFEQTNYDFNIVIFPDIGYVLRMDFNELVYETAQVKKIIGDLDAMIEQVVDDPSRPIESLLTRADSVAKYVENSLANRIN